MTDTHSAFPPSAMYRLVPCVGSHAMTALYPEREDTPAAMEGVAAHYVCAELAAGRQVQSGALAPNGIAITDEMIEGGEMFVDTIPTRMLMDAMPLHIEQPVQIPAIHETCWGTPDLDYTMDGEISVKDYKFGHGYVDVYENYQLIAYAIGVLDRLKMNDQTTRVNMTIVQPRCYHHDGPVRTWSVRASELRPYINKMRAAVESALAGSGKCVAGDHCNHCPAAHACEALQLAAQRGFDFVSEPVPSEMSPIAKGLYLKRVNQATAVLEAIKKGLEEEVEHMIRNGSNVPGFALQAGQGRLGWNKSAEEVGILGDMFGASFRKAGLITPTQAKALLKKSGIDESVISGYSAPTSGGMKLVQSDSGFMTRIFKQEQ